MIALGDGKPFVKTFELNVEGARDLALIDDAGAVWTVVPIHYSRWWDFATLLWWFFCPADKRAVVVMRLSDQRKVRVRCVRIASKHVRLGGSP
jgi:hypothetical protein